MEDFWKKGYASEDIIANVFRVCKTVDMPESLKLEFIKEISVTQLRIVKGVQSLLQLSALLARLCEVKCD
jgi:replication factor C subunit 2/4